MWEIIRSFGLYILSVISLICFYWHSVWAEWLLTKLSITGGPSVQSDGFTLHHAVQERFSVLSQRRTGPVLFCLCKIYLTVLFCVCKSYLTVLFCLCMIYLTVLFCLCQIFLTIHIVFTKDLIVRMLQCLGFFRFNIFIYLFFLWDCSFRIWIWSTIRSTRSR